MGSYVPGTSREQQEMLQAIGLDSFDQLFEKNVVDKISVGLSKRVDAFSHFCLLLKEKLEKDEV